MSLKIKFASLRQQEVILEILIFHALTWNISLHILPYFINNSVLTWGTLSPLKIKVILAQSLSKYPELGRHLILAGRGSEALHSPHSVHGGWKHFIYFSWHS